MAMTAFPRAGLWELRYSVCSVTIRTNQMQSEASTLERELASLLALVTNDRDRILIGRYLGWDGQGGGTLESVGREFNMTRERVRQICSGAFSSLHSIHPCTPVLDNLLSLIEQYLPAAVADIESTLRAAGLTTATFRLRNFINAAQILERKPKLAVLDTIGGRIAMSSQSVVIGKRVLQTARQIVRHCGASTIAEIAASLKAPDSHNNDQLTISILGTQSDFRWLDPSHNWFWFPASDNRLLIRIRKVFAVVDRIKISELQRAICSDRRLQGFCPPKEVLLEFCAQLSWCRIEDESYVIAVTQPRVEDVLSKSERLVLQVLKEHSNAIDAGKFRSLCAAKGIGQQTLWFLVYSSPIILREAHGVYALVGATVGVANSLLPPLRRTSVLLHYGWRPDGSLWLGFKLSRGMIRSGVFGVPTAMRHFLHGEYAIVMADAKIGTLALTQNAAWGIGPVLRRLRSAPGDLLIIRFDSASRMAHLYVNNATDLSAEFHSLGTALSQPAQG